MFQILRNCLLIAAVIAATGTHWLVLQSVAWTGMLANNLKAGAITEAVERTFDGKHPCALCKQISRGKRTEKKPEFQSQWKRLEFSHSTEMIFFSAPTFFWQTDALTFAFRNSNSTPPVPPPKTLLG